MAGINPNLGNLKLQNLQLSKTAEVDTQKAEDKGVGDAKPAAVWFVNWNKNAPTREKGDVKPGDVIISIEGDKVHYYRVTIDAHGTPVCARISADDIQDRDYETDRGDLRRQ